MKTSWQLDLPDVAATETFAQSFAHYAQPPLVVLLSGDLGAGKTTWVRAVLRAWGWVGTVRSPTYTLLETYDATSVGPVHHLDLYRLRTPAELEDLGLADLWVVPAVWFIEWPTQGRGYLPPADLTLDWVHKTSGRQVRLAAASATGERLLAQWAPALEQCGAARTCQSNEESGLSE
jgi:tRNA threonylcarbamoyladenosine biosynthesis protein TsaE